MINVAFCGANLIVRLLWHESYRQASQKRCITSPRETKLKQLRYHPHLVDICPGTGGIPEMFWSSDVEANVFMLFDEGS